MREPRRSAKHRSSTLAVYAAVVSPSGRDSFVGMAPRCPLFERRSSRPAICVGRGTARARTTFHLAEGSRASRMDRASGPTFSAVKRCAGRSPCSFRCRTSPANSPVWNAGRIGFSFHFLIEREVPESTRPSARSVRSSSAIGRTSTQPRRAPGIRAATRIASLRSRASST